MERVRDRVLADGPALSRKWPTTPQTSRRMSAPGAIPCRRPRATDLENLLGTGVGAAQEQLERNGGFLPFALVVENDGEVRLVAVTPADARTDRTPTSTRTR